MEKIKGLNSLLSKAVSDGVFPGCTYCLVTPNEVYYDAIGNKLIVDEFQETSKETLYDMASVTKVVCTTTSIMILLERGLLRLYDSVSLYLERFKYKNITIWDLLTHSSGLPADAINSYASKDKEELLDKIYDCPLKYEKNTDIIYSDLGFMLLGFIIEKVSGVSLEEFVTTNIFKPLKMTSSCYNPKDCSKVAPTEVRNDRFKNGYVLGDVHDEKAFILGGVAGHAGLFSNCFDMSKFIQMILNDGVLDGVSFLSKPTIDLLFKVQVKKTNGISLSVTQRGLGWIVKGDYCSAGDLCSEETIHHTGFTGTNIFIDRQNKVGFSLLSNRVHPTRSNVLIIPFRGRIGNYIIANFGGVNNG